MNPYEDESVPVRRLDCYYHPDTAMLLVAWKVWEHLAALDLDPTEYLRIVYHRDRTVREGAYELVDHRQLETELEQFLESFCVSADTPCTSPTLYGGSAPVAGSRWIGERMSQILERLKSEPVLLDRLLSTALSLAIAFGLEISVDQKAALIAAVQIVGALVSRSRVTPVHDLVIEDD